MLTEGETTPAVPSGSLQVEVFARRLREAIRERNHTGEGQAIGEGGRSGETIEAERRRADARRVATKVGRGMLAATNLDTARHADDVVVLAGAICNRLEIRGSERQDLLAAARLHDIGKAAVPRAVIEKPGPLSQREWRLMRVHTEVGARILDAVPELHGIATLVRHSHERWDGRGYPDRLRGDEIPLGSRVIFCADAFHAIRSNRPYRPGRSAACALAELRANAGTQFDPEVVLAFEAVSRELRIARRARPRRSSRVVALLLCLTLGGAGSVVARSGLLGEPSAADPAAASVTSAGRCEALLCTTPFDLSKSTALDRRSKAAKKGKGQSPPLAGTSAPSGSTGSTPAGPTGGGVGSGGESNSGGRSGSQGPGSRPGAKQGQRPPPERPARADRHRYFAQQSGGAQGQGEADRRSAGAK